MLPLLVGCGRASSLARLCVVAYERLSKVAKLPKIQNVCQRCSGEHKLRHAVCHMLSGARASGYSQGTANQASRQPSQHEVTNPLRSAALTRQAKTYQSKPRPAICSLQTGRMLCQQNISKPDTSTLAATPHCWSERHACALLPIDSSCR
jgi:hypothetical protein